MKILLTGGAGFIGSHTAKALLKEGHTVAVFDNFNSYYDPAQKEKNLAPILEQITLYRADITNQNAVQQAFQEFQPDLLLHLAARAGVRPSIQDPELYHKVNLLGTLNLLEACKAHNIKRAVLASSSSVYGKQEKIPFSETDLTESPISPYAATKRGMENMAYTYHKNEDMQITCLRFFTVYGPAGRPDMAPYLFTKWIHEGQPIRRFGDGSTQRDYTYIDDIVQGILAAVQTPLNFEIINLGNNQPVTLNTFISTIEDILGKKAEIEEHPEQPGDVPLTYADISKAQKLLNYQPKTSLKEGLQNFINWYLECAT